MAGPVDDRIRTYLEGIAAASAKAALDSTLSELESLRSSVITMETEINQLKTTVNSQAVRLTALEVVAP